MRKRWIWIAPAAFLGIILFTYLGGELVRYLWNWLLPGLFGWRQITFWQALGLLLLCRILFGGLGVRGSHHSNMRSRMRRRMAERWEQMTPEEREKARERWSRCGFEPPEAKPTP
jgi:hypothetical protein